MKPVLIFDGDCGFCTTTANYIVANSKTPIKAEAWQLTDTLQYGILEQQAAARVQLVEGGHVYQGHEAFARLLSLQPNPLLKAAGFILIVPPVCWLARIGYKLAAKYRHKLPGGTPACKLETKGE